MEEIFLLLLQFLGEIALQLLFEVIGALIGASVKEMFRRPAPAAPGLAALGYLLFGAAAGVLSLWPFPDLFIAQGWLRWANVVATPLVAGGCMSLWGAWRRKHELTVIRLSTFAYGYCFAVGMAVVRFIWGF